MAKRLYTNKTNGVQFIGGEMIPPGETQLIEELFFPAKNSIDIENLQVKSIAQIADILPTLSDEQRLALLGLELKAAKPRSGVIELLQQGVENDLSG